MRRCCRLVLNAPIHWHQYGCWVARRKIAVASAVDPCWYQRHARSISTRNRTLSNPLSDPSNRKASNSRKDHQLLFNETKRRRQLPPQELNTILKSILRNEAERTKEPEFAKFVNETTRALDKSLKSGRDTSSVVDSLKAAYIERPQDGLEHQIKYEYFGYLLNRNSSASKRQDQNKLADLRFPVEWYPATRALQRKIHLHVGPTNSGKTYHALKRLEDAESGLYAGPLRLLAHEVYSKLNLQGKRCHLITGDERHLAEGEGVKMTSCTVEMVPTSSKVEVAVIDEIQMIGNQERGWAWTQAVLGLQAKELHLCGEERSVPLIRELSAAMGDELQIHHYQRLNPLKSMANSLGGDLKKLRKGDCVIAFSKMAIHSLKQKIERITKKPVAIVYGSLPPEVRAQQAALFNDPDNDYDILVASDAIGMGLNLSIKRIIFSTTSKFDGAKNHLVPIPQMKQISGRAGRYRTAAETNQKEKVLTGGLKGIQLKEAIPPPTASPLQNVGLVTSLESKDLERVQTAINTDPEPIMTAGLFPPTTVLLQFAAYFPPSTPFSYVLLRLHQVALVHPRFHLCLLKDHLSIADIIEPVRSLTVSDRIIFCIAPAAVGSTHMASIIEAYARCVGQNEGGGLLDIAQLNLELLNQETQADSRTYLEQLESLHKALILYLWLSYRFAGVFTSREMAFYVKGIVEGKIHEVLTQASVKRSVKAAELEAQRAMLMYLQSEQQGGSTTNSDQSIFAGDIKDSGALRYNTPVGQNALASKSIPQKVAFKNFRLTRSDSSIIPTLN